MSLDIRPNPSVTGSVTGSLVYKGSYNAATSSPSLVNAQKGDFYIVSTAGTLAGVTLNISDHIVFNQNAANPVTSAMFDVIDNTETQASETVAGIIEISTNGEATAGTATDKALVPSNLSSIGTSQLNNDAGFISSVAAASETVAGIIEISTNAEATTGTATNKALVPSNLSSIGTSQLNNDAGFITSVAAASETVAGKIEISTNAEATAGTATDRALVPSNLSSIGTSQLNNDAGFISSVAAASETVAGNIEIATNAEATTGTATDKALVPSNISSIDLNQLDEVSYTAGAGIDGKFLKYVNSNNQWEAADVPTAAAASETVAGIIEISTNGEATTGTATNKALVPSNISSIGTSQLNNDAGFISSVAAASETVAGKIEIATNAEATTGTATNKALVPSNLSSIGTSQLNNDAGFITSVAAASETVAGKIEISTNAEAGAATATDKALVPSNISSINTSDLNNDAGFISTVAAASETVAGKIEIATNAEATAGTATDKALVPSNISSIDLNQLDEVSYTAGAGIDGKFLKYVNSNNQWEAADAPTAAAASETVAGVIEISTNAEATTGTATNKALVPSNLSSIGTSQLNNDAAFITDIAASSETVAGKIEISTNAEATAGTATDKALVPSNISSIDLNQLDEISYTAGAGIDGQFLKYVHSNNRWEAAVVSVSPPTVAAIDDSGTDSTIASSTGSEEIHLIDNGSTAVVITIPTASTVGSGYKYNIKRLGDANVTVQSASISSGNNQIDGSNSYVIQNTNESVTLVSNGTTFFII